MKLLVIVLCLLSERFLIHKVSLYRFSWFSDYTKKVKNIFNKKTDPLVLFIAIAAIPVGAFALIYLLLHSLLFGLVGFLANLFIFYYCLGPGNPFYPISAENENTSTDTVVAHYFVLTNSQLFAALFWYLVLGPIGLLAYRIIDLCQTIPHIKVPAKHTANILEWIPARLEIVLLLLAGNFQRGFSHFINSFLTPPENNNTLISECGLLAVRHSDTEEVPLPVAERLVEYALVIYLVIIALFTLASWM